MGLNVCDVPQDQTGKQDLASDFIDAMIAVIDKHKNGMSKEGIYSLIDNWVAAGQVYIGLGYIDSVRAIWIRREEAKSAAVKPSQQLRSELKTLSYHLQRDRDQKVIREKFFQAQETMKKLVWGFNHLYEKTYPKEFPNHQSKMLQIQEFSAKKQWAAAPCNQHL